MGQSNLQTRSPTPNCPDLAVLEGVALGKLPADQLEEVADHVERRPACQDALGRFDALADSLLRDLQHAPAAGLTLRPELDVQIRAAEAISHVEWGRDPVEKQADAPLPRQVGQYELLERIGRGGMGVVYKARHVKLKRLVAVKLLSGGRLSDEHAVERFHREMEAVASLDHPNIIRAIGANEADGRHFLVMELIEGIDLARLVRRQGPFAVADACRYGRQAALALHHAHEHGLVHRDVKPSNLMLDRQGRVKLLDLGLARLRPAGNDVGDLTEAGQVLGTADFIPPEQAADPRLSDPRADVYSLGCTLFFLLAGRAPFADVARDTPMKRVLAHSQDPVPALSAVRQDVPRQLDRLVARMMAKQPADRPSAMETASALAAFTDTNALPNESNPADNHPGQRTTPGGRAYRKLTIFAFGVAAILLLGGIWMFQGDRSGVVKNDQGQSTTSVSVAPAASTNQSTPTQIAADQITAGRGHPVQEAASKPAIVRRPRPASWGAGALPPARPSETGAGFGTAPRFNYFYSWLAIGPFLYDTTAEAFDTVHPIEQDWVSPGERFSTPQGELRWVSTQYPSLFDVAKVTRESVPAGKAAVFYAVCWAKFPSTHHEIGWELYTGCDNKFWVDGKLVKAGRLDGQIEGAGLQRQLDEGWNELLLKLVVSAERDADARPCINFQVIFAPDPAGRPEQELWPYFMNEPPE